VTRVRIKNTQITNTQVLRYNKNTRESFEELLFPRNKTPNQISYILVLYLQYFEINKAQAI